MPTPDLTKQFVIPERVYSLNPQASLDPYYGPFSDQADAFASVPIKERKISRPIAIYEDPTKTYARLYTWSTTIDGTIYALTPVGNVFATQTEAESQVEPATETNKAISTFSIWKWMKALKYLILNPNADAGSMLYRLRSTGLLLKYTITGNIEKTVAFVEDIVSANLVQPYKTITGNVTIDDSYHNAIVRITSNATITIPSGLRVDFNASFYAKNTSIGTFVAGSGVTILSPFGLVLRDNAMGTLFPDVSANNYIINGGFLPA